MVKLSEDSPLAILCREMQARGRDVRVKKVDLHPKELPYLELREKTGFLPWKRKILVEAFGANYRLVNYDAFDQDVAEAVESTREQRPDLYATPFRNALEIICQRLRDRGREGVKVAGGSFLTRCIREGQKKHWWQFLRSRDLVIEGQGDYGKGQILYDKSDSDLPEIVGSVEQKLPDLEFLPVQRGDSTLKPYS